MNSPYFPSADVRIFAKDGSQFLFKCPRCQTDGFYLDNSNFIHQVLRCRNCNTVITKIGYQVIPYVDPVSLHVKIMPGWFKDLDYVSYRQIFAEYMLQQSRLKKSF